MKSKVIQGNNIDILKGYPDNHFDSIVTDPPYGIEFLAKEWDKNTGAVETWAECFRVLKPGGYILAFSAARTYHNLATNIESVGFEIRDQLMWLYSSGFPKAQDVGKAIQKRLGVKETKEKKLNQYGGISNQTEREAGIDYTKDKERHPTIQEVVPTSPQAKQWAGWKTALKPAHEPIVMARKPFKGSCVDNVLKHGVGALNIDATRIGEEEMPIGAHEQTPSLFDSNKKSAFADETIQGRFPSNVLGEVEGYQKFFYCPKVSRAERHIGFETKDIPTNPDGMLTGFYENGESNETGSSYINKPITAGNNHPTVKPVALMKYLIKLVTPQGGKILDPFTGSGSTGMAAVELDYDFTGCELDADYVGIANNRITAWKNKKDLENNPLPEEWFEEK